MKRLHRHFSEGYSSSECGCEHPETDRPTYTEDEPLPAALPAATIHGRRARVRHWLRTMFVAIAVIVVAVNCSMCVSNWVEAQHTREMQTALERTKADLDVALQDAVTKYSSQSCRFAVFRGEYDGLIKQMGWKR